MRIVVALGGNALLQRGEPAEADVQRGHVERAARAIAEIARRHDVVVTHGNGPQVGLLALQAAAYDAVRPYPLDVLGAESEGMIGYLLEQSLTNALPGRRVAAVLTQVVVDRRDPAFERPTKPIGPVYDEAEARRLAAEQGFAVAPDGRHFRRVVPSPEPLAVVEIEVLRLLVEHGVLVVCVGGGGIPVAAADDGALQGVEAVIDKDLSAALLARLLCADFLLMLTDVSSIERDWGTPEALPIRRATPDELRALPFAAGSMGPKVEAACRFVEATRGTAAIGALEDAAAIVRGQAGTLVTPAQAPARVRSMAVD
jgi:carbamate kinase